MHLRRWTVVRAIAALLVGFSIPATQGCGATGAAATRREVWGFTAFWDTSSAASVARNGASLDALVTTWIALDTAGGLPNVLYVDTAPEPRVPARRFALVTSYLHPSFRPAAIRRLAANPRALARAAGIIASTMAGARHDGVVLDFEALTAADLPALIAVVATIADSLHARQLGPVAIAIPANDTTAYPGMALIDAGVDFILPMLYDQHWAGGDPGPVAEPRWVEAALKARMREVGAARIVAGLPLYGYRWASSGEGVTITFPEAARALGSGLSFVRDSATGSLRATLADGGQVWVTDATLLSELFGVVERMGVHKIALWYVGQEDPAIWSGILAPVEGKTRRR